MDGKGSDLAALRGGSTSAEPAPPPTAGGRSPALWLGLGLLAAGLLFAVLTWERWLPATEVRAARVAALPASAGSETAAAPNAAAGQALFQAAGWIEADPLPLEVTAQVGGFIEEVLVLEGEAVSAGQVLARLDDTDLQLAMDRAAADRATARAAVAAAEQAVASAEAELARLDARLAAADARIAERRDLADRYANTSRAFAERERSQAQLALATAEAERAAIAAEGATLRAAVGRAEAEVVRAEAAAETAAVVMRRAEVDLARCEIRAPIDGVIARLHAYPGRKQLVGMDDPHSTSVAELFDPEHLQARIDVALADAARIAIGQPVELATEALPDQRFAGEVTRIVGEADIARNTVQVKVRLDATHPVLRPGVLVRARFMGRGDPESAVAATDGNVGLRLVLPADAAEAGAEVERWVVGESDRAVRRTVRFGPALAAGGVAVRDGLGPGELVLIDPPADLAAGQRLEITEVVE